MSEESSPTVLENLTVRTYEPSDQRAVSHLYGEGLLAGQIAPNDTGADIDNMQDAYFTNDRNHFWVAEVDGKVLGMIGVAEDETDTAEIRRLRVDKSYQGSNLPSALLETAINHCRHHGYLKVRLDTRFEKSEALGMFDRSGFEHTRTKNVHGKDLHEFYLDLYRERRED